MIAVIFSLYLHSIIAFRNNFSGSKKSPVASLILSGLKGYEEFVRTNPLTDKFSVSKFHHLEFFCGDATSTVNRFRLALGMQLIAKSDQSTGNTDHCSYAISSSDMTMVFTAPYPDIMTPTQTNRVQAPFPNFSKPSAVNFFHNHGIGVRAIALNVNNVQESFNILVENGGIPHTEPVQIADVNGNGFADFAEVRLYGDVILRLVNTDHYSGVFLPNFSEVKAEYHKGYESLFNFPISDSYAGSNSGSTGYFGFTRFDHVVGNLWSLEPTKSLIKAMTGFHDFAEFVAEDVGTIDSGLNSVVLANNNEAVLLPLNEPTYGTKRKSQIQTYLEQNKGEGVQHIAMFTSDIFRTMRLMRAASQFGGFSFVDAPGPSYYTSMRQRLGDSLDEDQYRQIEELGLLADKDDQGVLLQVFTRPVGDRATLFLEVIQRIGCITEDGDQKPGCGGFGKGNFRDLFKSIEDYEKKLNL